MFTRFWDYNKNWLKDWEWNFFALLDRAGSDLEDNIDELMIYSDIKFVFEKEGSEKDDVSDDQPKHTLIPEANV